MKSAGLPIPEGYRELLPGEIVEQGDVRYASYDLALERVYITKYAYEPENHSRGRYRKLLTNMPKENE